MPAKLKKLLLFCSILLIPYAFYLLRYERKIDEVLKPYYSMAMKDIGEDCYHREFFNPNQINVTFDFMSTNINCNKSWHYYDISVNQAWWNFATEDEKIEYMFSAVARCEISQDIEPTGPLFVYFVKYENLVKRSCTLWKNSHN